MLDFTRDEIECLTDFIETEFIQSIRNDQDIENIAYIVNICTVYKKLKNEYDILENNLKAADNQ